MRSFAPVTEVPGSGATPEQLMMLSTRYRLASELSAGRDVLEVACGPGIGLGMLAREARRVVGGDVDDELLRAAKDHYSRRVSLLRLDAQALPFGSGAFDVVILFEALYYLREPASFLHEVRRVLRLPGTVLISTVNREWRGFNPSPLATRYLSAQELAALMRSRGFAVELFGAFPAGASTIMEKVMGIARDGAVRLHLIPSTMKGKERLKRMIYGRLSPLPAEIVDGATAQCVPIRDDVPVSGFKIIYALGRVS